MYELLLFDKGYTFEKRWVFIKTLTISGDVRLQEYSCKISPLVFLDFYPIEFDDYILEL